MDFFDKKYYALSKMLFVVTGNWPYQNPRIRFLIQIIFLFVIASIVFVQMAKLITHQYDLNLMVEILTNEIIVFSAVLKHFLCSIKTDKIKDMLERMETNWKIFSSADDHKIVCDVAEDGRKFNVFYTAYAYSGMSFFVILFASLPLIDVIIPFNISNQKILLFPAEYFIDEDKYFYLIIAHMYITVIIIITPIIAADVMYSTLLHHAYGLFKITSNRLKHTFDKYKHHADWNENRMNDTCDRIAAAVNCHLRATKFVDDISAIYGISIFLVLLPIIFTISTSLFRIALFFGDMNETMKPIGMCMSYIIVISFNVYPAQKVLLYSADIPFKAYDAPWYIAPYKEQSLLLPIMRRGLKPSAIVLGNMYIISRETYMKALQISFSFFTVLLSLK